MKWRKIKSIYTFLMLMLIALFAGTSISGANSWKEISTDELKSWMDSGKDFLLIDVRPSIFHDAQSIPGSINIPLGKLKTSSLLPEDKNKALVFYCMGRA